MRIHWKNFHSILENTFCARVENTKTEFSEKTRKYSGELPQQAGKKLRKKLYKTQQNNQGKWKRYDNQSSKTPLSVVPLMLIKLKRTETEWL